MNNFSIRSHQAVIYCCLTCKIDLCQPGEAVQGPVLHTGDVIVHQQELAQVGEVAEPGGGDHLEEVVAQGEPGETGQTCQ